MQNQLFSGPWRPREASNHTRAQNQNFQKVPDNFAFMKKLHYFITQMCVRVSMCPCVQVIVRPSVTAKSAVTYESLDRPARNFQGPLNSLQVIFGWVIWTPGPSGSGPDPEKGGFCQFYLLLGFWSREVVSYLFRIGTTRQTKCLKRNFDF